MTKPRYIENVQTYTNYYQKIFIKENRERQKILLRADQGSAAFPINASLWPDWTDARSAWEGDGI